MQCTTIVRFNPSLLDQIAAISRVVPIDPIGPIESPKFQVGPITDLAQVQEILDARPAFANGSADEPVDFIRGTQSLGH